MTLAAARALARRDGLRLTVRVPRVPHGYQAVITAQSARPGTRVKRGATIALTAAARPIPRSLVPDIRGWTIPRARALLDRDGFRVLVTEPKPRRGYHYVVARQSSRPGTRLLPGTIIRLIARLRLTR
jgi:beta-lactam-binding protein with PASTA domain